MKILQLILTVLFLTALALPANAVCTNPEGAQGEIVYNVDHSVFQGCTSGGWRALSGGGGGGISKLTPQAAAPSVCDASTAGSVAMTDYFTFCVCNEGFGWATVAYPPAACEWALDSDPDAFAFTDLTNQQLSTLVTSDTITITGLVGNAPVTVSGDGSPQISKNGGGWGTPTTIANGNNLRVRLTSSASGLAAHSATVTIGSSSEVWTVTTGVAPGQQVFTTSGSFVVPANVTNVSLVAVGAGGEGSAQRGGDLRWHSGLAVTPGKTLTVEISTSGGQTRVHRGGTDLLVARGGNSGTSTATGGSVGGGNGGAGGGTTTDGGGGAGGYSGNGGAGGDSASGSAGSGGGGGGGGAESDSGVGAVGGGGGGVGLLGAGASGAGGNKGVSTAPPTSDGAQGQGGSGGSPSNNTTKTENGGLYDGGAGTGSQGGGGAVRFIWGVARAYPSTLTADM